ncbi:MAG: hypothetical protein ACOCYU_00610 [Brevefilum sp.]
MDKKTVGAKEGLGVGIIAIGLLLAFMPSAAQQISDLEFIESSPFSILLGTSYVLALFIIVAGIAVTVGKFQEPEEMEEEEEE